MSPSLSPSMIGKTCLITGANSGIGRAAALGLARRGATVYLGCRDEDRGRRAAEAIRRESGNPAVELLICDLAEQSSIRRAADEFQRRSSALHVLINNAGASFFERRLTVDGVESVLAVNYLGHFLLTVLLLDRLRRSAPARIVNVAGKYHRKAKLDLDDLQLERGFQPMEAANRAQLAKVIFNAELARRLDGSGVTANAVHPGAVRTPLQRKLPWRWRLLATPLSYFFLSPRRGAEAYLHLACSPALAAVTGRYFERSAEAPAAPEAGDVEIARKLWKRSEELCGL